jgi:hypothetical protein
MELPSHMLTEEHLLFLNEWGVTLTAERSILHDAVAGLYVWHSDFKRGVAVSIVAREDICQDPWIGPLYTGVAREAEFSPEKGSIIDFMVDAAIFPVKGLHDAIVRLNSVRGLPSGHRLPELDRPISQPLLGST